MSHQRIARGIGCAFLLAALVAVCQVTATEDERTSTGVDAGPDPVPENSPVWTLSESQVGVITSSPTISGGLVFLGSMDGRVYALNLSTAEIIWSSETNGPIQASPIVVHDVVFVGSLDGKAYAFDASDGTAIWAYQTGNYVHCSPAVGDGTVFVGSYDKNVHALNESTGLPMWIRPTPSQVQSLTVGNGRICVGGGDGWLSVLDQQNGRLIWSLDMGSRVDSAAAFASGVVLVACGGKVYALDEETGVVIWDYEMTGWLTSAPKVAQDKVIVGSGGHVYALELASGNLVWEVSMGGGDAYATPADGTVFLDIAFKERAEGYSSGWHWGTRICALNSSTGALLWNFEISGGANVPEATPSTWPPAVGEGLVLAGLRFHRTGDKVYAFAQEPGDYVRRGCTGIGISTFDIEPQVFYVFAEEEKELGVQVCSTGYEGNLSGFLLCYDDWLELDTGQSATWARYDHRPYVNMGFIKAGEMLSSAFSMTVRVADSPLTEPLAARCEIVLIPTSCVDGDYDWLEVSDWVWKRVGELLIVVLPDDHEGVFRGCTCAGTGTVLLEPRNLTLVVGQTGELGLTVLSGDAAGNISYEGNISLSWLELDQPEPQKLHLHEDHAGADSYYLEAGGEVNAAIRIKIEIGKDEEGEPYVLTEPVTVRCRAWVIPKACYGEDDWEKWDRARRSSNWVTITIMPPEPEEPVLEVVWEQTYGDGVGDSVLGIATSDDGGFMVAREARLPQTDWSRIYLLKLAGDGDPVWEREVDCSKHLDAPSQFLGARDGGFVLTGVGEGYVYVLKLNEEGSNVWEGTYAPGSPPGSGAYSWYQSNCAVVCRDGGLLVAGSMSRWEGEEEESEVFLLRVDAGGGKVWEKTFARDLDSWAFHVEGCVESADGGFVLTEYQYLEPTGPITIWKVDLQGNLVWEEVQDTYDWYSARGIVATDDDCVVVACRGYSEGSEGHDYLLKLDGDGGLIWERPSVGGRIFGAGDGGFLIWSEGIHPTSLGCEPVWFWDPQPVPTFSKLVKYDGDGGVVWEGKHGAGQVIPSADGGYMAAGVADGDVHVVRLDRDGGRMWERAYGDSQATSSITATGDGGFLVGGYTHSPGASRDAYLLKIDAGGNLVSAEGHGAEGWDSAECVVPTEDGGFLVAANKVSYDPDGTDVYLLRVDGSGVKVWEMRHSCHRWDYAYGLAVGGDGSFLVVGETTGGDGGSDIYLLRVDGSGKVVWEKTYGRGDVDSARCAIESGDGGFLIGGYTYTSEDRRPDPYVLKVDDRGNVLWERTYGGLNWPGFVEDGHYWVECIAKRREGGFIVGGRATGGGWDPFDVYLLRIDGQGDVIWEWKGQLGDARAESIVDCGDGYVVAGYRVSGEGARRAYVAKFREVSESPLPCLLPLVFPACWILGSAGGVARAGR